MEISVDMTNIFTVYGGRVCDSHAHLSGATNTRCRVFLSPLTNFREYCVIGGPFHGAIAVPSVTRCRCRRRCRCRGHRCAGGARQYR